MDAAELKAPLRRRWFQFRLRTLFGLVTLAAVVCAAVTWWMWWVAYPMRTWERFLARIEAGDIEGANKLCDTRTFCIVPDDFVFDADAPQMKDKYKFAYDANSPQSHLLKLEMARWVLLRWHFTPFPRSWDDMVNGQLQLEAQPTWIKKCKVEIRKGSIHACTIYLDPR